MTYNWALRIGSEKLAAVQTFARNIEQEKIVTKALDGSIYIQTIGSGAHVADVQIYATRAQRDKVNEAEASGEFVNVLYRGEVHYGYIEAAPEWTPVIDGRCYTGTLRLLLEMQL